MVSCETVPVCLRAAAIISSRYHNRNYGQPTEIHMYREIAGSCMKKRTVLIVLLCLVSAAVLVAGCTSQTSGSVTTLPTTMVPATVITLPSGTVIPPGTTDTIRTTGTPSTPATSSGIPTATLTDERNENVRIKARNFAFDPPRITVPAGSQVTVEFENEDGAPHNVAFYTTPSLTTTIYKGAIIDGPGKITYVFTAPAIPGTYFFRCDLHPSMQGQFIVS
jgi:plastocyanin